MRIWYVQHYAVPASEPGSGRGVYLAEALAGRGYEVDLFAATHHHFLRDPVAGLPPGIVRDPAGYRFHSVGTPPYAGNGASRLRNMLAFGRRMGKELRRARRDGNAPDVIIVSSPHPFAWPHLYRTNHGAAGMIFEERDIWPLSLTELLHVSKWHPLVLYLKYLMRGIHRNAAAIVSLFPVESGASGVGSVKRHCIPNGVSPAEWVRAAGEVMPPDVERAFSAARGEGKLVVLYAGAMGPPNALDVLFRLGDVAGKKSYRIFLMGDGVSRQTLEERASREGLDYLTFLPRVNRRTSWSIMLRADALFFALSDAPALYRHGVSLNKLFDYLMAGKPVVQVRTGSNHPVRDSGGGFELKDDDPGALHAVLEKLAAMPAEELSEIGKRGHDYALTHNNWDTLGERYAALCERVALPGK